MDKVAKNSSQLRVYEPIIKEISMKGAPFNDIKGNQSLEVSYYRLAASLICSGDLGVKRSRAEVSSQFLRRVRWAEVTDRRCHLEVVKAISEVEISRIRVRLVSQFAGLGAVRKLASRYVAANILRKALGPWPTCGLPLAV